jgi:hypothetical protein
MSPPREPAKKKRVVPRRQPPPSAMGDPASSGSGVKESSLMWPMLTRDNYTE